MAAPPTEIESLQRQIAELQAQLAAAPREHGVKVEGDNGQFRGQYTELRLARPDPGFVERPQDPALLAIQEADESFLFEVLVVRERRAQPLPAHDLHRAGVCHAVTVVRSGLIQS